MVCVSCQPGGAGQSRLQEEHYKFDGLIDSGVRQVQHLQFISCKVCCFLVFFLMSAVKRVVYHSIFLGVSLFLEHIQSSTAPPLSIFQESLMF